MRVKLVTFDVTNTIIKVLGSPGQQYASIGNLYGVTADPKDLNRAFIERWREQNKIHPNYGVTSGKSSYTWWTDIVKQTFSQAGFKGQEENLEAISGHLYKHFTSANAWDVLPYSHSVLQQLKDRGIMLGVISNFDSRLEKILMNLELLHYFQFILTSEKVKVAKPDKKIFIEALNLANISADDSFHIGDNVENDYFGALNAGMNSVLLATDISKLPNTVDKKFCISNLSELLNILK
ncbi:hypothetical protein FSP39_017974 [Pinctada imbricata]|uniref:Haloacid dehalogenase-like hydrolase domain-containing protein 3 n=1 Tax=Pinctada imbricata TaxID=66713 RepID=A0AA88XN30_PINIB|nr:hypothetical protein FSP39_017974 [Pinctada imbricata]